MKNLTNQQAVKHNAEKFLRPASDISILGPVNSFSPEAKTFRYPSIALTPREQWCQSLKQFVWAEAAAEKQKVRVIHSCHQQSRIMRGECLTGLKFKTIDQNGSYVYSFQENHSKFKAGDFLVINDKKQQGDAVLEEGSPVWLETINHSKKIIKLLKAFDVDLPQSGSCTLDKSFCDFSSTGLTQAIDIASHSDDLMMFLQGEAQFAFTENTSHICEIATPKDHDQLSAGQKKALASNAKATIIQGPPGSGKTYLLALIIELAISNGKSVLLTGPSWCAIEKLLSAVALVLQPETPIYKLKPVTIAGSDCARIQAIKTDDPRLSELQGPYVFGTTVYQAIKLYKSPSNAQFGLVVIDEAGQMPIAHALPALISAERYVIAGDHKQLRPIFHCAVSAPIAPWLSIFEHLNNKYPSNTITLDIGFRMNHQINEFPSLAFYDSLLKPSTEAAARTFQMPESTDMRLVKALPASFQGVVSYDYLNAILNDKQSVTFVELDHRHEKRSSTAEAKIVAAMVATLVRDYCVKPTEIAIIATHRKQTREINAQIAALANAGLIDKALPGKLESDTVDRFQGQEREVVIFSLTSSDPHYTAQNQDFLYCPNRLNVAITRSRTKLIVVGSKYFFPHHNDIMIDTRHAKLWESYYQYLVSPKCGIK